MKSNPSLRVIAAIGLWLAFLAGGSSILYRYEGTPGPDRSAPPTWPKASGLALAATGQTLVMFVHPECPCTRASLHELAVLNAHTNGGVRVIVSVLDEDGLPTDTAETENWRAASAIPGATVRRDKGGVEAARFRAATSGRVVLYDASGRLLFSGGVTASRGHEGDNAGRDALLALVQGAPSTGVRTAVFGCALFSPCTRNLSKMP